MSALSDLIAAARQERALRPKSATATVLGELADAAEKELAEFRKDTADLERIEAKLLFEPTADEWQNKCHELTRKLELLHAANGTLRNTLLEANKALAFLRSQPRIDLEALRKALVEIADARRRWLVSYSRDRDSQASTERDLRFDKALDLLDPLLAQLSKEADHED